MRGVGENVADTLTSTVLSSDEVALLDGFSGRNGRSTIAPLVAEETLIGFEDLVWLFQCDTRNRKIVRLGFDEAALLWKATRSTAGPILEVGRNKAGSTCLIAAAGRKRDLYSIDIRPRREPATHSFLQQAEYRSRVHLLVGDSRLPLGKTNFGFLFIDGDHSFDGMRADVWAHWNALESVDGKPALAAFHDAVPNDNLVWRDGSRHLHQWWRRLKNALRTNVKSVVARDYEIGVYRVCHKLIECGCAEKWASAGSMLVLRKLRDLPDDFRDRFNEADLEMARAAGAPRAS